MDEAQFHNECLQLARPRLNLRRHFQAGEVVGVWGGAGPVPHPPGRWIHRITVACDWLRQNGFDLSGQLSVYENQDDVPFEQRFVVIRGEHAGRLAGGVALVGVGDTSLPPVEALETCGSTAMQELIQDTSLASPLDTYDVRCPLHYADADGIYAMLGGWHESWPEDDSYDHQAGRLVLWTFRDAEPWLEVWWRPSGLLQVVSRIT